MSLDTPWTELIKTAPAIIRAAAQSNLGIFALMLLILCVLALVFFYKAEQVVKVTIFGSMFLGVFLFGLAATKVANGREPDKPGTTARTIFISGFVFDAKTHRGIRWAKVTSARYGSAITDDSGEFHLEFKTNAVTEKVVLVVTATGYETSPFDVITSQNVPTQMIDLTPSAK